MANKTQIIDNYVANMATLDNVSGEDKVLLNSNGLNQTAKASVVKDYVTKDIKTQLNNKVDKVSGKELSSNDYTNSEKQKLADTVDSIAEMNKDVATIASDLANLKDMIKDNLYYGIEFDTSVSSHQCTRIGNMSLHRTLPVQSQMRGVLLSDNGEVIKYLDKNDWTQETRDGSNGQVMVEIPEFWWKFEEDGTKRRVLLSSVEISSFKRHAKQYVSAYQATIQHSTNKLCSVVNSDADYRGGNNNASWDGTYRSLLTRPVSNLNRTDFRKFARNRKKDSAEWNCMTYDMQKTLYWLFVIEYATLNSQATYNSEPTAEGFRQGGLGAGVTTIEGGKWNTFNGYNPFIPCGYTDELGNRTGVIEYTMPTEYNATETKVSVPRYRGIENPFGYIWQWADGVNVRISATKANGGDDLSQVFVCHDPAKFNDSNYDGYSHVGNEARNGGYVKELIFGEGGEIVPKVCTGAGSTTYICDYHYTNIPSSGAVLRGLLFGGSAVDGANAGLACALSSNTPSNTIAYFGSRLCFFPATA